MKRLKLLTAVLGLSLGSLTSYGENIKDLKIAFISDVHFHDVYGDFGKDFAGIKSSVTGKNATIRTMESQMNSTRLFNENYFAFIAALEDARAKNIKYIALPGDFSDDGQPVHVEGVKRILDEYSEKYGMEFFLTFGNHDPNTPFTLPDGKNDYLGIDGRNQPIFSQGSKPKPKNDSNPVIYSELVKEQGYEDIMKQIGNHGFFPKKSYIYWETPFSKYDSKNYSYEGASEEATLDKRTYEIGKNRDKVIDGSYLVEPVKGLWLLAIDANVYMPKDDGTFDGSGNAGYNKVLSDKAHILEWVKKVSKEAKENGKTLVAFSHYPMIDFFNGAGDEAENIFGKGKFELKRVPQEEVAKNFADAGIKIHFAGHMHFNDTGVKISEKGNSLVNVQVPSIAAYVPAYKILSLGDGTNMEIDTVVLKDVPGFDELFEHYAKEHEVLTSSGAKNIWNRDILKSKSYYELTDWHIKELVRLRFLPKDWPQEMRENILSLKGKGWTGMDLVTDLYRLRNADELALENIPAGRVDEYIAALEGKEEFKDIKNMLEKFAKDHPSENFTVNIKTGEIKRK